MPKNNSSIEKKSLPRAIAKEKNGVVLYWIEDLQVAGLSHRGIARLLDCNDQTVVNLIKGTKVYHELEAETITEKGIQVLKLVTEESLSDLLIYTIESRCKSETKKNAANALKKLAKAGFRLMVMMEIVPQQLADQAQVHADAVKLQELKNEGFRLEHKANKSALELRQFNKYVAENLPEVVQQKILGFQTIEKTEYRDRTIYNNEVIDSGDTVNKTHLCHRYKFYTKTGKPDYRALDVFLNQAGLNSTHQAWKPTLFVRTTPQLDRNILPELDAFFAECDRQLFLGE